MTGESESIGRVIVGRYELLDRIGAGGMAVVYRARDRRLDRLVAVKVLHTALVDDAEFRDRFEREARAVARLSSPHVLAIYDSGRDGDAAFIAMELVAGGSLLDHLRQAGRLAPARAITIARQVLAALTEAHLQGLVHRDVKPHNVLLMPSGDVKLADFGIARAAADVGLTQAGTIVGSPTYLAPEQAVGGPIGPATDIYGVGLLLYEMVVGRAPFVGGTPVEIAYRQVHEEPTPPSQVIDAVPPGLEAIVLQALAKDGANRFRTAEEMSAALAREEMLLAGQLDRGVTPGPTDATVPLAPAAGASTVARRPSRTVWLAGIGLAVALAVVGLIGWLGSPRDGREVGAASTPQGAATPIGASAAGPAPAVESTTPAAATATPPLLSPTGTTVSTPTALPSASPSTAPSPASSAASGAASGAPAPPTAPPPAPAPTTPTPTAPSLAPQTPRPAAPPTTPVAGAASAPSVAPPPAPSSPTASPIPPGTPAQALPLASPTSPAPTPPPAATPTVPPPAPPATASPPSLPPAAPPPLPPTVTPAPPAAATPALPAPVVAATATPLTPTLRPVGLGRNDGR